MSGAAQPRRRACLPSAAELTWEQYAGRACVWCRAPLTTGAVSVGRAHGQLGVHQLDVEVWACPVHAHGSDC